MNIGQQQPIHTASLTRRAIQGGAIALALISFLLFTADSGQPAWGRYWMIRPLLVVTAAGAAGGVFFHLMDVFRVRRGWKRIAANLVSLLVYLVGLWLGIVLGLDGTMWN